MWVTMKPLGRQIKDIFFFHIKRDWRSVYMIAPSFLNLSPTAYHPGVLGR